MSFTLSQFALKKVVFEFRYESAYLFWDKAGKIGEGLKKNWPEIKMTRAEPGLIVFKLNNNFVFQVSLEKATISEYRPSTSLEEFISNAEIFETLIRDELNIESYKRLGFRPFYYKEYKEPEKATLEFLDLYGINPPKGKHFNIEGKPKRTIFVFRWEGEKIGIIAEFKTEGEAIEYEPPIEANEIEPINIKREGLWYSIDYYTIGTVNVNKLNVKDWINNCYHLIKRDSKVFLEKSK